MPLSCRRLSRSFAAVALALGLFALRPAAAEEALAAVAANFKEVVTELAADYEQASGNRITVTTGSTGKLYAQIVNGAPFDILLAADQARPERLEQEGRAVAGSRFTYAVGRLALWSKDPEMIGTDGAATLAAGRFNKLAMANPDLAPYGVAALETLSGLALYETLQPRIVMGENIGQTFALIATGNADLGFVALSALMSPANPAGGSRWEVPANLYSPIRQDAVLLTHAEGNAAAAGFLAYLKGEKARAIMTRYGYGTD